jgi:sigma-B regulation protein RsbU (phosphoserine phosphatase)
VNAGHNPPVVVRTDGSITHLEPTGLMIGAFDFSDWTESRIELSDGDLLFIFSDGVTEAQRAPSTGEELPDAEEDQYGDERMEKLLVETRQREPEEVVDCMMHDILAFIGDAPRSDDITMMVIKRKIT